MTKVEEKSLIIKAQAGDSDAAEELIRYCTPVIHTIARRQPANRSSIDYQDILQSGKLGVLDAIRLWREEKARGRFIAFARIHIQHSITRLLDEMNETIRIPIGGRRRGLSPIPVVTSGSCDYIDLSPADNYESQSTLEGLSVDRVEVRNALKLLSSRERLVVRKLVWDEATLEDIARELGLSLQKVWRIKQAAFEKLRDTLGHYNSTSIVGTS